MSDTRTDSMGEYMSNLFFDTEFTDLQKDAELLSIGIVADTGETFYAEVINPDVNRCSEFVKQNVLPNMYTYGMSMDEIPYVPNMHVGDKNAIAASLEIWLKQFYGIQFISDVCHYDFALLCDLFGGAEYLPNNASPVCHDINQDIAEYYQISENEAFDKSREEILSEFLSGKKHNAMYDARVIRSIYEDLHSVAVSDPGEDVESKEE